MSQRLLTNLSPVLSLVAVVGETASGKSALAMELAGQFNGEIICADSRTVFMGMDIGTAKPSKNERRTIPHHLLDAAKPDQKFSVADFQKRAYAAIIDIQGRGKVPFLVGGSGLYIDAVLFNFRFVVPKVSNDDKNTTITSVKKEQNVQLAQVAELESLTVEQLQQQITAKGLPLPENISNKRYLIGVLQRGGVINEPRHLRPNTLVLGLNVEREQLQQRITKRAEQMFAKGVIDEARTLFAAYGQDCPPLQNNIYGVLKRYLNHEITREETISLTIQKDMQLAKKQRTWFKRNNAIQWLDLPESAHQIVARFLDTQGGVSTK